MSIRIDNRFNTVQNNKRLCKNQRTKLFITQPKQSYNSDVFVRKIGSKTISFQGFGTREDEIRGSSKYSRLSGADVKEGRSSLKLYDSVQADSVDTTKTVSLHNQANVNKIENCENVKLYDNSTANKIEAVSVSMSDRTTVNDIDTTKDKTYQRLIANSEEYVGVVDMSGNSNVKSCIKTESVVMKDKAKARNIDALGLVMLNDTKASQVQAGLVKAEDDASIRVLNSYNVDLKDNVTVENLSANALQMSGQAEITDRANVKDIAMSDTSKIKTLYAEGKAVLEGNSKVEVAMGSDFILTNNASIDIFAGDNINKTSKTPSIILDENAKVKNIIFQDDAYGIVYLLRDKLGKTPDLSMTKIANGMVKIIDKIK